MSSLQPQTQVLAESYDNYMALLSEPLSMDETFATNSDFEKLHNLPAIPFRQLEIDTIYRIMTLRNVRTKSGKDSMLLHLYTQNALHPITVWATSLLQAELASLKDIKNLFIKYIGVKTSICSGRTYHAYQLVQKN